MADEKHKSLLPEWLAERREGAYIDGRRFDEICYLQCKLILKPDRFTSARVFKEFATLVHQAADKTGVEFHHAPKLQQRPEVREVRDDDRGEAVARGDAVLQAVHRPGDLAHAGQTGQRAREDEALQGGPAGRHRCRLGGLAVVACGDEQAT